LTSDHGRKQSSDAGWTRRRWLGTTLAAVAGGGLAGVLVPVVAPGVQVRRIPRIGYLGSDSRPGFERMAALEEGLLELGYVEGSNLVIDRRLSQDQTGAEFERMAVDLVTERVDLIVTSGTPSVQAAARATRSVPNIAAGPHRSLRDLGLVENLARPGSNVTGLEVDLGQEAKRVELLHEVVPTTARLGVLRNPSTGGTGEQVTRSQEAGQVFGLEVIDVPVRAPDDLDPAFARVAAAAEAPGGRRCASEHPPSGGCARAARIHGSFGELGRRGTDQRGDRATGSRPPERCHARIGWLRSVPTLARRPGYATAAGGQVK
jgi:ABC transporter substrate binding protein